MPVAMYEPSPAWPHGQITQIFDDAFFVMGTNRVHHAGVDLQTSRTMLVVREAGDLTLINSVRLDAAGLAALELLGSVKQVIRLGAFHGRDDPFYRDRYAASLWALPGSAHADERDADRSLSEAEAPLRGARVCVFRSAKHPEAALLLPGHGGILVTCDAIQNWARADPFFSAETAAMFEAQGLIRQANIPSTWLAACAPARDDFDALLALDFRHLVSAHGEPLLDDAHACVAARVREVFGAPLQEP
jgi:hypothetical protein